MEIELPPGSLSAPETNGILIAPAEALAGVLRGHIDIDSQHKTCAPKFASCSWYRIQLPNSSFLYPLRQIIVKRNLKVIHEGQSYAGL